MASHRRVASAHHSAQGEAGERRAVLKHLHRVVVKIGSGLIADRESGLSEACLGRLAADVARLLERGLEVLLVSGPPGSACGSARGLFQRSRRRRLSDSPL